MPFKRICGLFPERRHRSNVRLSARKSNPPRRKGIRTQSEKVAAIYPALFASLGVSIITRSAPFFERSCRSFSSREGGMVTASGASPRASDQSAADAWGSRSTIAVSTPESLAATARWTATVVLPTPPFSLTIERTFTSSTPSIDDNAARLQSQEVHCQLHSNPKTAAFAVGNNVP